jgi:hypothetical protein
MVSVFSSVLFSLLLPVHERPVPLPLPFPLLFESSAIIVIVRLCASCRRSTRKGDLYASHPYASVLEVSSSDVPALSSYSIQCSAQQRINSRMNMGGLRGRYVLCFSVQLETKERHVECGEMIREGVRNSRVSLTKVAGLGWLGASHKRPRGARQSAYLTGRLVYARCQDKRRRHGTRFDK